MSLFEQILNTNIINFLIVFGTLVLIYKKANLGSIIEKLAADIQASVEKSANATQNALKEYKEIKKSTKDTPKLQEEIISNANINAQTIKENFEQKAILVEQELKSGLEKIYNAQKEKTKNQTIKEVWGACITLAKEEVVSKLDYETHKKLINSSIDELDKIQGGLS